MDSMVRLAALRLARKVAFGASFSVGTLVGCGRAPLDSEPSVVIADAAERTVVEPGGAVDALCADAAAGPDAAGTLACAGPVQISWRSSPSPPPAVTRAQYDCCLAYARKAWSAGPAAAVADPSAVNCCRVLIAAADRDGALAFWDDLREQCCYSDVVAPKEELYAHFLCGPWGPPVPPAIDDQIREVA
jgi:hypothetical protein